MVAHKAKFDQYLDSLVEEREKMAGAKRDVFSWFLDPYLKESVKAAQMQKNLVDDAMLIVIAGSGPTAPALAATFYHLALHPHLVERLHKELQSVNFAIGETTQSISKFEVLGCRHK
jgi:cytochrome P450